MTTKSRAPSPRFKLPDELPNVAITDDDIALIWYHYRLRLIDSESIYSLFPTRSKEKLSKRLNNLRKARYLGRLPKQALEWQHKEGGGSTHLVHALDYRGAQLLRDRFNEPVPVKGWKGKNESFECFSLSNPFKRKALEATKQSPQGPLPRPSAETGA